MTFTYPGHFCMICIMFFHTTTALYTNKPSFFVYLPSLPVQPFDTPIIPHSRIHTMTSTQDLTFDQLPVCDGLCMALREG